jgi:hypothetical protein
LLRHANDLRVEANEVLRRRCENRAGSGVRFSVVPPTLLARADEVIE